MPLRVMLHAQGHTGSQDLPTVERGFSNNPTDPVWSVSMDWAHAAHFGSVGVVESDVNIQVRQRILPFDRFVSRLLVDRHALIPNRRSRHMVADLLITLFELGELRTERQDLCDER